MSESESIGSSIDIPKMLVSLIGKERATILSDELGYYLEQLKVLGLKEVRPWGREFFAIFKPPQPSYKYLETR